MNDSSGIPYSMRVRWSRHSRRPGGALRRIPGNISHVRWSLCSHAPPISEPYSYASSSLYDNGRQGLSEPP